MTGTYVRVERDGTYQNLEIDQLSDAELQTFFWSCDPDRLVAWACFLARWIREHVHEAPERPPEAADA